MKSTLSITGLLTFAIGIVSSEITGQFKCNDNYAAELCMEGISEFSIESTSPKYFHQRTKVEESNVVVLFTNDHYNTCFDFTNEIMNIDNCKPCTPIGVDNNNPEYCIYKPNNY